EIFAPHFVDRVEVLHVAHIDVDAHDVVEGAAGLLDRGFQVLADLAGLRLDIADAGDAALGAARRHAGEEHEPTARLGHDGVRKMPARLAQFARYDLLLHDGAFSLVNKSEISTPARTAAALSSFTV